MARDAFVAQLVEQRTENPRVVGSIPTGGTICGFSSFGRARPCQGRGGGFEPRNPLQNENHPKGWFFVLARITGENPPAGREGSRQTAPCEKRPDALRDAGANVLGSEPLAPKQKTPNRVFFCFSRDYGAMMFAYGK